MISHSFKTKIYYKDTDQMGIVYYSRYFEFFESARTELLASIGLAVRNIEENDVFLPVISAKCDYKKSAKFEDEITVVSSIDDLPTSRLIINYRVLGKDESILASGSTVHGFINANGTPKRPPQILVQKIKTLMNSNTQRLDYGRP